MIKKITIITIVLHFICFLSFARQDTNFREINIVPPVVNNDGTVTFKLRAPFARTVTVNGDWEARDGVGQMVKDSESMWSYTTDKLSSDLYLYAFMIDGVRTLDPLNAFSYRDVGNLYSLFMVNGGNGDYYSVNDVPHGTVNRIWYPSKQYSTNRRLTLYTPPGYAGSNNRYPVLYLLHGSGGDEEAWITLGRVSQIMDNMIAEGKIEPMIVVMPNGNPSKQAAPGETPENYEYYPTMSEFLPDFGDGSYEISFDEIVNYIDSQYRTEAQKSRRAIVGFSMGGFHSMIISANHPELFDYVGLFSAGMPVFGELNTAAEAYKNRDDKLIRQKEEGHKLYRLAVRDTDFGYESVQEHRKRLDKLDFPYTYVETTGGHIWSNRRKYLLEFIPELFKE